jgi:hypothetical protein
MREVRFFKECQGELVEPVVPYETRLRQAQTDNKIIQAKSFTILKSLL